MNMTSNCDVTKNAHQIQMTTICRWMKTLPMKIFCVRYCLTFDNLLQLVSRLGSQNIIRSDRLVNGCFYVMELLYKRMWIDVKVF